MSRILFITLFLAFPTMGMAGGYVDVGAGVDYMSMRFDGFDEVSALSEDLYGTPVNGVGFISLSYNVKPGIHNYVESGIDVWGNTRLVVNYLGGPTSTSKYENFAISLLPQKYGMYVKADWKHIGGQAELTQRDVNSVVQVIKQPIDTFLTKTEVGIKEGEDYSDGFLLYQLSINRTTYKIPQIDWTTWEIWNGSYNQLAVNYFLSSKTLVFYGGGLDLKYYELLNTYPSGEAIAYFTQGSLNIGWRQGMKIISSTLGVYISGFSKKRPADEIRLGIQGFLQETQTDSTEDGGQGKLSIIGWGPTLSLKYVF